MNSNESLYSYYCNLIKNEVFPCLILDLDLFKKNMSDVATRLKTHSNNTKTIRVASKSVRSIEVLKLILNSDEIFKGILSYSLREALFLHSKGFTDIVVAYPEINRNDLQILCKELQSSSVDITLMVDSIDQVKIINEIASSRSVTVNISLDIDLSTTFGTLHFGVRRSPVNDVKTATTFTKGVKNFSNVKLVGVMGYEAQIAGVPDKSPAKNSLVNFLIRFLKKRSIKTILLRREKIVNMLVTEGFELKFINGGGTGSVETTSEEKVVTEVTVGSGFYAPVLFDYYNSFKHYPSLFYALEVVRIPTKNIYTCHGGGYVASGSLGIDKIPQPYLPEHSSLLVNEMAGEVQTPIENKNYQLKIGDPVFMRHAKAGELCEHFKEIIVVSNGEITKRFKTYRGEGVVFL